MISSMIDSNVGKKEFELLSDQEHMEAVWRVMQPKLERYANEYLEGVSHYQDLRTPGDSFSACYQSGVLGFGIVSNILNHMYPRTFPGNYKAGVYSLHFLTGCGKGVNMPSDSSEFLMVKDDSYSKTGIIETEHNYYFPYETFGMYTLRIYRLLEKKIFTRFQKEFPTDYRYLLTNDFYEYVTSVHRADIATLCGNDDLLKFNTIW